MQKQYSISGLHAAHLCAAAAIVLATLLYPASTQASGPIESTYNLPTNNSCGTNTVQFSVDGKTNYRVYKLNDVWHKSNPCLKFLRSEAAKRDVSDPLYDFVYHQMLYILSQSKVKFYDKSGKKAMTLKNVSNKQGKIDTSKFKTLVYTGKNGQAYDAMGAADLGVWALDMHKIYLNKAGTGQALNSSRQEQSAAYKAVSLAAMETIITSVDKGGMRTRTNCAQNINGQQAKCSWYHSKTNDTKDTEDGLSINKTLGVVRDLWRYGHDLRSTGSSDLVSRASEFEKAAVEGVHQMVYGKGIKKSKTPTLFDFVPRDKKGNAIQESWLYYGVSGKKDGYFLKNVIEKNCGYHKRNISLLATIFKEFGSEVNMKGFTEKRKDLNNKSILEFMIKSYEIKQSGNLGKNENTKSPGNFQRCVNETGAEVTPEMFAYLRSL